MDFNTLIDDIEKLAGKELHSIARGSVIVVDKIDRDAKSIVLHTVDGIPGKRSFEEIEKLWIELKKRKAVHVDSTLGGSGSRRNQPETILANLPYIEWLKPDGRRKHIVYVGRDTHVAGELKEMSVQEYEAMQQSIESQRTEGLINHPHNLIFFGAPGTGKSFQLQELAEESFAEGNVRRVTFYPDYTYAQFVGCYKPFIEPKIDNESDASEIRYASSEIEYRFIPGPFIDTYVDAIRHPEQNYLLIIEEINRANPAAVFGDVFQLLDRKEDGTSEYSVVTSEDLRWYMFKQWKSYLNGVKPEERNGVLYSLDDPEAKNLASSISLPPNMYIWATMNSADQGVFPMDTAFKRRWDFCYMGINDGCSELGRVAVPIGKPSRMVSWDALRRGINKVLLDAGVNEDKLLGPFFISPSRLRDTAHFTQTFMDKVLLYLFEDAAKTKKSKVFSIEGNPTYSDICDDFKARGELAFKGMKELASIDEEKDEEAEGSDGTGNEA